MLNATVTSYLLSIGEWD